MVGEGPVVALVFEDAVDLDAGPRADQLLVGGEAGVAVGGEGLVIGLREGAGAARRLSEYWRFGVRAITNIGSAGFRANRF